MGTMQMKLENGMPLAVGADLHATTDRSQSGSQYAGIVSEVVRAIPYRLALRRLLAAMAGFGWRQNRFDESAIRGHVRDMPVRRCWPACEVYPHFFLGPLWALFAVDTECARGGD